MLRYCYVFNSTVRPRSVDYSTKCTISCVSGGFFRALAGRVTCIDAFHRQRYVKAGAQSHAVPLEVISGVLQAMMDVDSHNLLRPLLRASREQSGRISAAAQAYCQRQLGTKGVYRLLNALHSSLPNVKLGL